MNRTGNRIRLAATIINLIFVGSHMTNDSSGAASLYCRGLGISHTNTARSRFLLFVIRYFGSLSHSLVFFIAVLKKLNLVGLVGNVGKSKRFLRRLFQAARGNLRFLQISTDASFSIKPGIFVIPMCWRILCHLSDSPNKSC